MRRLWLLLIPFALVIFAPSHAHAQQGNTITIRFAGAPTGSCSPVAYAVNNATGDFYDCKATTWNLVGGGGGSGCAQGTCIVNAPTADQTITGAHAFKVNGGAQNIDTTTFFIDTRQLNNQSALDVYRIFTTPTPAATFGNDSSGSFSAESQMGATTTTADPTALSLYTFQGPNDSTTSFDIGPTALFTQSYNDNGAHVATIYGGYHYFETGGNVTSLTDRVIGDAIDILEIDNSSEVTQFVGHYIYHDGVSGGGTNHKWAGFLVQNGTQTGDVSDIAFGVTVSGVPASVPAGKFDFWGPNTSSFGQIIDPGLSASVPVLTNGSKQLVSGAINLAGGASVVTGILPVGNLPSGIAPILSGTTGSIGGGALLAGACASGTATVTGATTGMTSTASPVSDPDSNLATGVAIYSFVSSSNTVTVRVCAIVAVTPAASAYNVRVIQ